MIFPTLEGLTAQEQEEFELQQLEARGYVGPDDARGRRNLLPGKVVDRMAAGVEYRAMDLMKLCKVDYGYITRLADKGFLKRTGERMYYRYSKVAS